MGLTVYVNCDTTDSDLTTSGIDFVEFQEGVDSLIFTAGNASVVDGASIPSQQTLISAGIQLTGAQIVVDKYFLKDNSAAIIKQIHNMGNVDKRYTLAFDFSASTASEPVLEVWDDNTFLTATGTFLGAGTSSNSFVRGVTTTAGSPGANWISTGTRMAGSGVGAFLELNDGSGALSVATTLYANLCIVVPASQTTGFSSNSVFCVKYLAAA